MVTSALGRHWPPSSSGSSGVSRTPSLGRGLDPDVELGAQARRPCPSLEERSCYNVVSAKAGLCAQGFGELFGALANVGGGGRKSWFLGGDRGDLAANGGCELANTLNRPARRPLPCVPGPLSRRASSRSGDREDCRASRSECSGTGSTPAGCRTALRKKRSFGGGAPHRLREGALLQGTAAGTGMNRVWTRESVGQRLPRTKNTKAKQIGRKAAM